MLLNDYGNQLSSIFLNTLELYKFLNTNKKKDKNIYNSEFNKIKN